jgi:hypothetical protein
MKQHCAETRIKGNLFLAKTMQKQRGTITLRTSIGSLSTARCAQLHDRPRFMTISTGRRPAVIAIGLSAERRSTCADPFDPTGIPHTESCQLVMRTLPGDVVECTVQSIEFRRPAACEDQPAAWR